MQPTYQFIKHLLKHEPDLQIDSKHMMVISPDEGGMNRAVFFANVLGLDLGMFYKRRDYTRIVNGRNPIVAHEFLGSQRGGQGRDHCGRYDLFRRQHAGYGAGVKAAQGKKGLYLHHLRPFYQRAEEI